MMRVEKYNEPLQGEWDSFIGRSVNGLFQHQRSFINYHGSKFDDHSLLIYDGNSLLGCIAGVIKDGLYISHPGLGLSEIIVKKGSTRKYRAILLEVLSYLSSQAVTELVLRSIPQPYKSKSTSAIDFYYHATNVQVIGTKLSMIIPTADDKLYDAYSRKIVKQMNHCTSHTVDSVSFHTQLRKYLQLNYSTEPLHTESELTYLCKSFPEQIVCYQLIEGSVSKAGACMFYYRNIAKLQYLYSEKGDYSRKLMDDIRLLVKDRYEYIDLGTSNSLAGGNLNYGNVKYKESLGGLAMLVNTYKVNVSQTLNYLNNEG